MQTPQAAAYMCLCIAKGCGGTINNRQSDVDVRSALFTVN